MTHLLKWRHQSEERSGSWGSTITEQRLRIQPSSSDSPSLLAQAQAYAHSEYPDTRTKALDETGLLTLPETCPFTAAQILIQPFGQRHRHTLGHIQSQPHLRTRYLFGAVALVHIREMPLRATQGICFGKRRPRPAVPRRPLNTGMPRALPHGLFERPWDDVDPDRAVPPDLPLCQGEQYPAVSQSTPRDHACFHLRARALRASASRAFCSLSAASFAAPTALTAPPPPVSPGACGGARAIPPHLLAALATPRCLDRRTLQRHTQLVVWCETAAIADEVGPRQGH